MICTKWVFKCSNFSSASQKVIYKSKDNKSCGFDKIPYEVLKFKTVLDTLHSLFQFCLDKGKIPYIGRNTIILPITKESTKDPRVPLNYRGISLLSCISKLYSSFLNNRLLSYLEANDGQNGFGLIAYVKIMYTPLILF